MIGSLIRFKAYSLESLIESYRSGTLRGIFHNWRGFGGSGVMPSGAKPPATSASVVKRPIPNLNDLGPGLRPRFRARGLGLRIQGLGLRVYDSGVGVEGSGLGI